MAIQSFDDGETESFFVSGKIGKQTGWKNVSKIVRRKLDMLNYASRLDDLKSPPGNRLELLRGNLKGFMSIRINDQWRVVFRWSEQGHERVRVIDYH